MLHRNIGLLFVGISPHAGRYAILIPMKIVLLEDIKGLGVRGDVCEVGDGYALNFLIPQKKALETKDARGTQVVQQKAVTRSTARATG